MSFKSYQKKIDTLMQIIEENIKTFTEILNNKKPPL